MFLLRFSGNGVRVGAGVRGSSARRRVRVELTRANVASETDAVRGNMSNSNGPKEDESHDSNTNNRNMKKNPTTKPRYVMKKEVTSKLNLIYWEWIFLLNGNSAEEYSNIFDRLQRSCSKR
ncbi:hypothetical protein J6590_087152 [Homalodisca vitripennis]|nr:hypothetical protein J6590_087152 [Homalodisca vitripennis]